MRKKIRLQRAIESIASEIFSIFQTYNSLKEYSWPIELVEKEFPVLHEVKYHLNESIITEYGIMNEIKHLNTLLSEETPEDETLWKLKSVIKDLSKTIEDLKLIEIDLEDINKKN